MSLVFMISSSTAASNANQADAHPAVHTCISHKWLASHAVSSQVTRQALHLYVLGTIDSSQHGHLVAVALTPAIVLTSTNTFVCIASSLTAHNHQNHVMSIPSEGSETSRLHLTRCLSDKLTYDTSQQHKDDNNDPYARAKPNHL